jgi:NADPH-dependent dioxygenase
MSLAPTTVHPVVIVGAGPTALTLAIELAARGVLSRVIDKRPGPSKTSRSFTLHARTQEMYAMAGYQQLFAERSHVMRSMRYHFDGFAGVAGLDFTKLESPFPNILSIGQGEVEEILRHRLSGHGIEVEWGCELVDLDPGTDRVSATINRTRDQTQETIVADWLIGCDGHRSTVREKLGFDFLGEQYSMRFRMMDVPLTGYPLDQHAINYHVMQHRMLLSAKLPSGNYRVLISEPGGAADTEQTETTSTVADFQASLDEQFHGAVRLGAAEWATEFSSWHRMSTGYRRGRVILCGDSVHVRSPAGGQGMNACIQDAFNLGWKLALVINQLAPETLLESYEHERRPIDGQVIEATHRLHGVLMAHETPIAERIALTQQPDFYDVVRQISGITYTYRDVAPIVALPATPTGPAVGDRIPHAEVAPGRSLHDILAYPCFTLLILQHHGTRLPAAIDTVQREYGRQVKTVVLTRSHAGTGTAHATHTAAVDAHELLGLGGDNSVCLVRPDGHVGFRSTEAEAARLLVLLEAILT